MLYIHKGKVGIPVNTFAFPSSSPFRHSPTNTCVLQDAQLTWGQINPVNRNPFKITSPAARIALLLNDIYCVRAQRWHWQHTGGPCVFHPHKEHWVNWCKCDLQSHMHFFGTKQPFLITESHTDSSALPASLGLGFRGEVRNRLLHCPSFRIFHHPWNKWHWEGKDPA